MEWPGDYWLSICKELTNLYGDGKIQSLLKDGIQSWQWHMLRCEFQYIRDKYPTDDKDRPPPMLLDGLVIKYDNLESITYALQRAYDYLHK